MDNVFFFLIRTPHQFAQLRWVWSEFNHTPAINFIRCDFATVLHFEHTMPAPEMCYVVDKSLGRLKQASPLPDLKGLAIPLMDLIIFVRVSDSAAI